MLQNISTRIRICSARENRYWTFSCLGHSYVWL